jgi:hypothetical protein
MKASYKTFTIKKGDTAPPLAIQIVQDSDNLPLDLTSATATFTMYRNEDGSSVKTNASTATIYAASDGKVRYDWDAADTDTPGTYYGEFTITLQSGKKTTSPPEGYIVVEILDKLGV